MMELGLENLIIDSDEEEDLIIDQDESDETNTDLCVVGRFLIDQTVNFKIVRSRLAATWKPKRGVSITEIGGGRILCQFYHALDVKRVLEGALRGRSGMVLFLFTSCLWVSCRLQFL